MQVTDRRDQWCERAFADVYDEQLAEAIFFGDAAIMEHDSLCCCDEYDTCMAEERQWLRARLYEADRRTRLDIFMPDPNWPTLEERLGQYGLEWEREQRERAEGRA